MVKYSIVVPTADRVEYLDSCVKTLEGLGDDYEVVIADNSRDKSVMDWFSIAKDTLDIPDFSLVANDPIGMRANWEAGVQAARGEYVTVLGDDDGFIPNGLDPVRGALAECAVDVITWQPHTYWWPNAPIKHKRNLLYLNKPVKEALPILPIMAAKAFYRTSKPFAFEELPMIYNSFVRKTVIKNIEYLHGEYFGHDVPDVWSGIVNAIYCQTGLFLKYPVTIRGTSGASNGAGFRGIDAKRFIADHKKKSLNYTHPSIGESLTLASVCASVKIYAYEKFSDYIGKFNLNIDELIEGMCYEISENHDRKDEIINDIRFLAIKTGHTVDIQSLKDKEWPGPIRTHGWFDDYIAVDTANIDVVNIHEASQLAGDIIGRP